MFLVMCHDKPPKQEMWKIDNHTQQKYAKKKPEQEGEALRDKGGNYPQTGTERNLAQDHRSRTRGTTRGEIKNIEVNHIRKLCDALSMNPAGGSLALTCSC